MIGSLLMCIEKTEQAVFKINFVHTCRYFFQNYFVYVAHGVCFALKSSKRTFTSFHIFNAVTFSLTTKFKSNRDLGYLSVNRIPH